MDFTEKYKPELPTDIVGNTKQILYIENWLENYEKNRLIFLKQQKKGKKKKINIKIEDTDTGADTFIDSVDVPDSGKFDGTKKKQKPSNESSCSIIIGDHGVGKTCTVLAILNKLKYTVTTVDLSKLGSNKSVPENVNKLLMGTNIYDKINEVANIKRSIVIDEIESANSPVEKNFILSLLKKNEENWYMPIIFISSDKHTKLNTTLQENCFNVRFYQPNKDELMQLLSKIAQKEKMMFDNISVGNELLAYCQNDFRRLVTTIQDLKSLHGKKSISMANIYEYSDLSKKKDLKVEIFKASITMMLSYKSIVDCLKMYEKEKVILPLVMHQNYIVSIVNNSWQGNKKFKLINDISRSFAFGDLVENYIYSDQNWDMQEVHGFLTCAEPAFKINCEKLNTTEMYLRKSFLFPYDLNRTSIKQINKRNIVNANSCLKNLEINDFIFANRLIRQLIADNKVDECASLFQGYGATVENVESILKIDKINETKTQLQAPVKKRLTQILGSKVKTKK